MLAASLALCSCGRDEQGDAIGELYEEDLAFTVNDFLKAAKEGRASALEAYLRAGMEVDSSNQFGERALGLAAERGHRAAVAVLLEAGAEFDVEGPGGRTPVMGAAEAGDAEPARAFAVLGPGPAPIARLRDRFRFQLLIKGGDEKRVMAAGRALAALAHRRGEFGEVRFQVDPNPINML